MHTYLMMIHEQTARHDAATPAQIAALIDQHSAFAKQLRDRGAYRDSEWLRPTSEGKRVRRRGESIDVSAGPFRDGGHALGGYYLIDAESLEAAQKLAEQCPTLPGDAIEVRPVMKGHMQSDKSSKPGKVFAFSVLGNAANESAWIGVMDRIDAETHDRFPEADFQGGARLEAPTTGRRLSNEDGKLRSIDGPFLEGKEVIGGLFFLRAPSLDEAVQWASQTAFVQHGTLEVRELWRS
jgi:hypothetical protein